MKNTVCRSDIQILTRGIRSVLSKFGKAQPGPASTPPVRHVSIKYPETSVVTTPADLLIQKHNSGIQRNLFLSSLSGIQAQRVECMHGVQVAPLIAVGTR